MFDTERLVGGLASEKVRWSESVAEFKIQEKTLSGDVLLITAFVSYVGYFTKKYRTDLMDKYWLPYLKELKVPQEDSFFDKGWMIWRIKKAGLLLLLFVLLTMYNSSTLFLRTKLPLLIIITNYC